MSDTMNDRFTISGDLARQSAFLSLWFFTNITLLAFDNALRALALEPF